MCYYSCIIFACQDWRWGDRKSYCRYGGEWKAGPCGLKFATETLLKADQCELCLEQNKSSRRRQAEVGRYKRWERERSLGQNHDNEEGDKLRETIQELDDAIRELQIRRVEELVEKRQQIDHMTKKRKQNNDEWSQVPIGSTDTKASELFVSYFDSEEIPSNTNVKCPYFLRHPQKHQKGSCMGPGFNKIGRLKEHIERVHMKPLQCPRCWEDMADSRFRDEHLRGESPCWILPQPEDDRVCSELLREIKSKKPFAKATTLQQRWEVLFKMIFPNDKSIPSPSLPNPTCTCKAQSSRSKNTPSAETSKHASLGVEHIQRLQSSLESELTKVVLPLFINVQISTIISKCIRDSLFPDLPFPNSLMLKASISQPRLQTSLDVELSRSLHANKREVECIALAIFMNMEEEYGTPVSSEIVTAEEEEEEEDDEGEEEEEVVVRQTDTSLSTTSDNNAFMFWDIYCQQSLDFLSFQYDIEAVRP